MQRLKQILDDENKINKYDSCKTSILIELNRYKALLEADGHPYYLIEKIIFISQKVWLICYKMKSDDVKRDINDLDALAFNYPIQKADLVVFLNQLSKFAICSKLHPAISNAFWGQMYQIYNTNIFDYMIDLKPVQTSAEVIINMSVFYNKIKTILNSTSKINKILEECEKLVISENLNVKLVTSCFSKFNDHCNVLQIDVSSVNYKCFLDGSLEWQKLITLISYNLKHMGSFDVNVQKSMNSHRIKSIKNFVSVINGGIRAQNEIYCLKYCMVSTKESPSMKSLQYLLGSPKVKQNIPKITWKNGPYENYFQVLNHIAKEIIFYDRLDEEFKLFYDGMEMTFYEVYNFNTKNAHDLQDGYDFQIFMVNWILTVLLPEFETL